MCFDEMIQRDHFAVLGIEEVTRLIWNTTRGREGGSDVRGSALLRKQSAAEGVLYEFGAAVQTEFGKDVADMVA